MPGNSATAGPLRARQSAEVFAATRRGDWSRVETLLRQGADANAQGVHNVTVLMHAARQGVVDTVNALLAHRADPNAIDRQGRRTVLLHACSSKTAGAPAIVKALLEASADARVADPSGATPLMLAAEVGSVKVARVLLRASADLSAVARSAEPAARPMGLSDRARDTLIHGKRYDPVLDYAEYQRAEAIAETRRIVDEQQEVISDVGLEEQLEVIVEAAREEEVTAAFPRVALGSPSVFIKGLLLEEGSSEEASSSAAEAFEEYYDFAGKYFLSREAPLRPQDLARQPPTGAARQGREARAQALRGVAPKFDGSHDTALVIAARRGHAELCDLLLHHSADASAKDGKGETALQVAAREGHYKTCEALLMGRPPAPEAHAAALAAAEAGGFQEIYFLLQGYKHHVPAS